MNAIELLARSLPHREPPELPVDATCCVLGTEEPCIGREHAIKPSFTNLDLLAAPDSDRVSVRAWRVLTHGVPAAEGKKRDTFPLMQSSWLCDGESVALLNRQAVRERVLNGVPYSQWSGYVTTSYKKHGSLRAPVNRNGAQRWLFELDVVDCSDREKVAEWWRRLRETREAGIPRPVIESIDCSVHLMGKHLARWRDFETWARDKYLSPLYRFLTYLLPSSEELNGKQD